MTTTLPKSGEHLVEILLIEDDPGDIALIVDLLRKSKVRYNIHLAEDGEEALRFLHREDKHRDATRPDFVLMDLNLPRKNGLEVLAEMKKDADLRMIPVIVLSSSKSEKDIRRIYDLQANAYLVKPSNLAEFKRTLQFIEDFWASMAKLPRQERS